ncbi:hypothetical protein MP228_004713 [Amoeboaphelidium protococcarum]|nr:hypothetical protein MP228_004713 [Amoeboaphelidium protococcarum]
MFQKYLLLAAVLVSGTFSNAEQLSDKCQRALDAFINPSVDVLKLCGSKVPPATMPLEISSGQKKQKKSSVMSVPDDNPFTLWQKQCSQQCFDAQNQLYKNIYMACGQDFNITVPVNNVSDIGATSKQNLPALTVFKVNILTRDLLCLNQKQANYTQYCWFDLVVNGKSSRQVNRSATCSDCAALVYASVQALSSQSYVNFTQYMEPYLEQATPLMKAANKTCPPRWFKNLPRPPFQIGSASKVNANWTAILVALLFLALY